MRQEHPWRLAFKAYSEGGHKALRSFSQSDRSKEVVIHIASRIYGYAGLRKHLSYVTRDGDLVGETQSGRQVSGKQDVLDIHREWMLAQHVESVPSRRHDSSHAVHVVISSPAGTDRDASHAAVLSWARANLANYDWLVVRHDDIDRPHSHISIRSVGFDNRRFNVDIGQIGKWREGLAREMRAMGIDASATRYTREHGRERDGFHA